MARKANRTSWKPGQSGNPDGKNKDLHNRIREQFAGDAPKIIEAFRDLALGGTPAGYEKAEIKTSDRIKAGSEVLDRVLGKPDVAISGDLGLSVPPEQLAFLAALRMTPEERRRKLDDLAAEDEAELAKAEQQAQDDDHA